jgi:hypothetical protein
MADHGELFGERKEGRSRAGGGAQLPLEWRKGAGGIAEWLHWEGSFALLFLLCCTCCLGKKRKRKEKGEKEEKCGIFSNLKKIWREK